MNNKWHNSLTRPEFEKNWDRSAPSFANINLLGSCNADCYFCLGKDIDPVFGRQNQMQQHFSEWPQFTDFITRCKLENIDRIYLTGQNTDGLLYRYLGELLTEIQDAHGLLMGLRTNGFLAHKRLDELRRCKGNPGFSIHTLDPETQRKIMGTRFIPDWTAILTAVNHCRVSVVVTRHNYKETPHLLQWLGQFPSIQYIQIRRICTDSREDYLIEDVRVFEDLWDTIRKKHIQIGDFYNAPIYSVANKEVCFWRTVKTNIDSLNYFTDGTISDEYFIIEGYMRESENYPKTEGIPVDAHGMGLEGFWVKDKGGEQT